LVVVGPPVVLEPVDQHLKGNVVRFVEVEALRAHLDVLLADLLLRHVTEHDVLWVGWQDGEAIGDATWLLLLLFLEAGFEIFERLGVRELLMADHLTDETVAWDDVSLDDLSQAFKLIVVTDSQDATDSGSRLFVALVDVNVNVVILPELPGQSDTVFTSSRWAEEEVSSLKKVKLRDSSA
jgi:hypothetical protein